VSIKRSGQSDHINLITGISEGNTGHPEKGE
jgi:hypothetical protein